MRRNKMRKKIERLERRDHRENKKAKQKKELDDTFSKTYKSSLRELDTTNKQEDDWKAFKKHPVTRIVVGVGVVMGLIYVSSHVLDLATKAATSYKKFRKALDS